jgi:hypothetical protein
MDERGRLSFFVDPNWQSVVDKADVQEIGLLLADFAENTRFNADALFKRICALNFGYLVTVRVETMIGDASDAIALYPHFVPL